MGSIAQDRRGNMALGYSVGTALRVSGDPVHGPLAETPRPDDARRRNEYQRIGVQTTTNSRWGDYTSMNVIPDDCTFWYVNEYYTAAEQASSPAGGRRNRRFRCRTAAEPQQRGVKEAAKPPPPFFCRYPSRTGPARAATRRRRRATIAAAVGLDEELHCRLAFVGRSLLARARSQPAVGCGKLRSPRSSPSDRPDEDEGVARTKGTRISPGCGRRRLPRFVTRSARLHIGHDETLVAGHARGRDEYSPDGSLRPQPGAARAGGGLAGDHRTDAIALRAVDVEAELPADVGRRHAVGAPGGARDLHAVTALRVAAEPANANVIGCLPAQVPGSAVTTVPTARPAHVRRAHQHGARRPWPWDSTRRSGTRPGGCCDAHAHANPESALVARRDLSLPRCHAVAAVRQPSANRRTAPSGTRREAAARPRCLSLP